MTDINNFNIGEAQFNLHSDSIENIENKFDSLQTKEDKKEFRQKAKAAFKNYKANLKPKNGKVDKTSDEYKKLKTATSGSKAARRKRIAGKLASFMLPAAAAIGAVALIASNPVGWAIGAGIGITLVGSLLGLGAGAKLMAMGGSKSAVKKSAKFVVGGFATGLAIGIAAPLAAGAVAGAAAKHFGTLMIYFSFLSSIPQAPILAYGTTEKKDQPASS